MKLERRLDIDGKEHVYTVFSEDKIAAKKTEILKLHEKRKELER